MSHFSHILIYVLALVHLLCYAQTNDRQPEELVQPFDPDKFAENFLDRIRSIDTSAPVSSQLRKNATAQILLVPTYQLFDDLYDIMQMRRNRSHQLACNLSPTDPWSELAVTRLRVFQVGSLNSTCFSFLDASVAVEDGDLSPKIVTNARDALHAGRETMYYAAKRMPLPKDDNWTDPGAPYDVVSLPLRRNGQTCTKENILAFRRDGKWYLQAKMTNRPTDVYMSDRHRHTIIEWIPRSFDHSLVTVQKRLVDEKLEKSTTIVNMWGGYGDSINGANLGPAVSEAFRQNTVQIDLASDAITPSNIAILALPMLLNFVPIAFIADINPIGVMAYVLFTDIISTIPFIVKGFELILSARERQPVVMGYFGGNETLGQMEVWSVECTGQMRFRKIGIAFVAIGFFTLVAGVVIELFAWLYMRDQKNASTPNIDYSHGPFGPVFMNKTSKGLFGNEESELQEEYFLRAQEIEDEMARRNLVVQGEDIHQPQDGNRSTWRKRLRSISRNQVS